MKKVTVFVGSARKKLTHYAASHFLSNLKSLGEVESEIIVLSQVRLGMCRGCLLCFEKGEEFCPHREDDRDALIEKMMSSDGVVIATPNYSFQVSAITKLFLERLGFSIHRPRFFGKVFTSIVAQGIYGGDKIVQYLELVAGGLGFNTVKGCTVTACDPITDREKQKIDRALAEHSRRFYAILAKPVYPPPTLFKLWGFRMGRTSIKLTLDDSNCDYRYYQEKGWFESDYYYSTRLSAIKKAAGSLFDSFATRMAGEKVRNRHLAA